MIHQSFLSVFDRHIDLLKQGSALMFSTGKDAICCLHILVKYYGIKPLLCYWNMQPFLFQMHKEPLDYFSSLYGVEYTTVIHYDKVSGIARKLNKREPSYKEWLMKLYFDQGERVQVFGIKDSDNLTAKMICNKGQRLNLHRLYPLHAWKDNHVFKFLEYENVPLPQTYKNGFRDINEFNDEDSLLYLKEKYPADYNRLIEIEPWRLKYVG